jgi:hypothetical protein
VGALFKLRQINVDFFGRSVGWEENWCPIDGSFLMTETGPKRRSSISCYCFCLCHCTEACNDRESFKFCLIRAAFGACFINASVFQPAGYEWGHHCTWTSEHIPVRSKTDVEQNKSKCYGRKYYFILTWFTHTVIETKFERSKMYKDEMRTGYL